MPPYTDANRAFLQAFLAKRVLTFSQAQPIIAEILSAQNNQNGENREISPESVTEQMFNNFVNIANDAISKFDFEIRMSLNQKDRSRVYALVNTTSDPQIQLATSHTADEISFFKRLMDAMFITNNTLEKEIIAIQSMQAIRLHKNPQSQSDNNNSSGGGGALLVARSTQPQSAEEQQDNERMANTQIASGMGLTMKEAETALTAFVEEGWLNKSKNGYYSLSPRSLMELKIYLIQTYNESLEENADENSPVGEAVERIKSCYGCKEIITDGQRCPTLTCPIRLHDPCSVQFFRQNRGNACPSCGVEWTGSAFVGEKADNGRRRVVVGGSGRRR